MKKIIIAPIFAAFLTACSGAPSDSDIKSAAIKIVAEGEALAADAFKNMGGNVEREYLKALQNRPKTEVVSVDNSECKDVGSDTFKCSYLVTARLIQPGKDSVEKTGRAEASFVEINGEWEVVVSR